MTTKLIWEIAAALQMLVGLAHIIGTIYSRLLHPKTNHLIIQMKETQLNIGKISLWKAWIFFNLAFGLILFILGLNFLYMALTDFGRVEGVTFYSVANLLGSVFIVVLAQIYSIYPVRTAFLIISVLIFISLFI